MEKKVSMSEFRIEEARALLDTKAGPYIAVYGCIVPSIILALFVPDDILSKSEWASTFSSWMAALIPMMHRASNFSPIPEVTKFYFAIMWAMVPFWLFLTFLVPEQRMSRFETMEKYKWFLVFFMLIFVPAAFYYWIVFPHIRFSDLPRLAKLMLSSRSGLALLGVIGPCGMSILTFGLIIWVKRVPRLYFNKHKET
jgi:hypothetical protein